MMIWNFFFEIWKIWTILFLWKILCISQNHIFQAEIEQNFNKKGEFFFFSKQVLSIKIHIKISLLDIKVVLFLVFQRCDSHF